MARAARARVLFLCSGNSCRSQMAEGFARARWPERYEALSAGTAPKGLDPRAARVMAEAGVDIAGGSSKALSSFDLESLACVVTVCGHADETCPVLPPGVRRVHVGFDDPPRLTADLEDEEARLTVYRRVRDEIRAFVERLPEVLGV